MVSRTLDSQYQQRWSKNRVRRAVSDDIRDIGPPPDIVDQERRDNSRDDLLFHLLTYYPQTFALEMSPDHIRLIKMTEQVLRDGGQVACAMPRGSGKTSVFQKAILWSLLHSHRRYPMLVCADDSKFKNLFKGIKVTLETNDLLLEDFPEIVHPIMALERSATRAAFQTCQGAPTFMKWGAGELVFPTTEWSMQRGNAGNSMGGGGLTGAGIRGSIHTTPLGEQVRPDAVLCDDPQTRKSASSENQCQTREDTIKSDIMGMAGPGKKMAVMVAMTVICRNDLAERLLDKDRSPEWETVKVSQIKRWPKNMDLWEKYSNLRRQAHKGEIDHDEPTYFYINNKKAMQEGAIVYWEARFNADVYEDALEESMAEYFDDPRSFMSEKQNKPDEDLGSEFVPLDPKELVRRQSSTKHEEIPLDTERITCHIDVQGKLLYWTVVAWNKWFGGVIVDFGTTPRQNMSYFTLDSATQLLQKHYPDSDKYGSIRQGILATIDYLSEKVYKRVDGAEMQLDLGLVDTRWKPDIVEQAIKLSQHRQRWKPCWGVGVGAKDTPLRLRKNIGLQGDHWVQQLPKDRSLIGFFVDTNWWKSEAYNGLAVPVGHNHAILFYEGAQSRFQMVADHYVAEIADTVECRHQKVDEWTNPGRKDNHFWDNLVNAMMAANSLGITKEHHANSEIPQEAGRRKRRVRYKRRF